MYVFLFIGFVMLSLSHVNAQDGKHPVALAIHGGAGNLNPEIMGAERSAIYKQHLESALRAGYAILQGGGTSLEAVTSVVRLLEDDSLFNAGKGSVLNHTGIAEMDAAVMEGHTLKAGAVCGIQKVRNPILAALAVMQHTQHVMLCGAAADAFALDRGLQMEPPTYFITPERLRLLQAQQQADTTGSVPDDGNGKFGTVGAVALDRFGHLSAATSTGGMSNKKYGRVGDTPIIGAGTYADATCAVSCTGHGEYFIRAVAAYAVASTLQYLHTDIRKAAAFVIDEKIGKAGGAGGLIAMDAQGNIAMPFNTPGMFRASVDTEGIIQVHIGK
jgi:beta-aspartyl-peptidase (threonine type)